MKVASIKIGDFRYMFRLELKKCMHPIVFLVLLIGTIYFVYTSIQPKNKYYYGQPLSKSEFIYAELKDDYVSGTIDIYQGKNLLNAKIKLSETETTKILSILKRMNKNFNVNENMSDVRLDLDDLQCINLMKKFEKETGYKTDYYYLLDDVNYPIYMSARFDNNSKNKSGFNTIAEEKQEFEKVLSNGISAAYARCAAEPLGVILGIIAVFFSSAIFSRDRKNKVNSYLYTSDTSSSRLILYRTMAVVLPLLIICFFAGVFCCHFFYKQNLYWGYDLQYMEFFKYILFWTVPTILIAVTSSIFMDLLFENSTVSFGLQFIIWFISITNMFGENNLFSTIISSDSFGHIVLYETSKITVYWNRFLMMLLSLCCFCGSVFLFERSREGKESFKNKVFAFISQINAQRRNVDALESYKKKSRSIWYYSWKRVFWWNILLCISYIVLILLVIYILNGKNMTTKDIASLGEIIIIFVSAFLFIPISNVESRHQVHEAVYLCKISYCNICFHRILLAVIGTVILSGIPLIILSVLCEIKIGIWCMGVCLSSVYLGFIGMLFSEVTVRNSIGYLGYIFYYMICILETDKMQYFSVMGYTFGMKYSKYSLLFGIVLCSIMIYVILYDKQKGRH